MSKWAVVETLYLPPQVIPCDDVGRVLLPHTIYGGCECNPKLDSSDGKEVLVHQDHQRGGCHISWS